MKILVCDLRRAVQDIFCFWGGTSWVDSNLKSLAGMQFKSLEEPFSTGSRGPKAQVPEVWLPPGQGGAPGIVPFNKIQGQSFLDVISRRPTLQVLS